MTRSNARRNNACFCVLFFVEEMRSKSSASHAYGTEAEPFVRGHDASRSSTGPALTSTFDVDFFSAAFASDTASLSPGGRGGGEREPLGFARMMCRDIVGASRTPPLAPAAASARTTGASIFEISRVFAGRVSSACAMRASDARDAPSGLEPVPSRPPPPLKSALMFNCVFRSVSALSRRRCLPLRACAPLELRFVAGDEDDDGIASTLSPRGSCAAKCRFTAAATSPFARASIAAHAS